MDFDVNKQECGRLGGVHDGLVCLTKDSEHFEGKYQSMNFGRLINNPDYLLKLKDGDRLYGEFSGVGSDHFDRVVAMEKDLSLSEQEKYIRDNEPSVDVYYIKKAGKNGIVKRKQFNSFSKMHWKELGEI